LWPVLLTILSRVSRQKWRNLIRRANNANALQMILAARRKMLLQKLLNNSHGV
jgi:hypothetical protein